jgi:histidine ammonia-lyase
MSEVVLGPGGLTREAYEAVVYASAAVRIGDRTVLDEHRAVLDRRIGEGAVIYSVTTGYGAEATRALPADALGTMQEDTVRSHAVGIGTPVPEPVVRGMLLLIAAAAAQGPPGLSPGVVDTLVALLEHRAHPIVPSQGSQSASDLVPAAHLALAVLGEGDVLQDGVRRAARDVVPGVAFGPKDGSIVNNTAYTTALSVHATRAAARLIERAESVAALTLQAVRGHPDAFDERLIALRPHPGAIAAATHLRALLAGSELVRGPGRPHDPFSLRCLPQVHGAVRDALTIVKRTLDIELRAITDNPVVLADSGAVLSGGNFHGEPLALPLDSLALGICELATLSQRRTQHLVNADLGGMTTPHKLSTDPQARLGMLMLPSLAAALVSECRGRTQPASRESIPVDAMEDHVSMAALAARQLLAGIELARRVVAVELAAAAQALDFLDAADASPPARDLHAHVRERLPFLEADRPIDVEVLLDLV